ncbi:hypothetical protein JCM30237_07720 [Halolamina litorea]
MRLEVMFAFARDDDNPLAESEETPLREADVRFVDELLEEHGFAPDDSKLDDQIIQCKHIPDAEAVDAVVDGITERYGESNVERTVYSGGEFGVSPDVAVTGIAIESLPETLRRER